MQLAHALVQAAPNVEVFTFGTRLTRVTRPLRLKRREQALSAAARLVSDWDGGTRIGDALQAFLAVPRFARLRARRGRRHRVGRAGARRTRRVARRCRKAVAARLARELADAARDGPGFPPADRGAGGHPAASSMIWWMAARRGHRRAHVLKLATAEEPHERIVDAHHHIWRQADMPWLFGPMQPRIFGPYEPIRRDYPIDEYLADIAGTGVVEIGLCAGELGEGRVSRTRSPGCSRRPTRAAGRTRSSATPISLADDVRPQLDRLKRYPLMRGVRMQLHWHENPIYRFAARPDLCRRSEGPPQHRARSPTTAGASTCRCSRRRWRARRSLPPLARR